MSRPGPAAPMPKCVRSAAEVACVRTRARATVRRCEGFAALMWIGVESVARECGESGGVSWAGRSRGGRTEEEGEDVQGGNGVGFCGAVEGARGCFVDYGGHCEVWCVDADWFRMWWQFDLIEGSESGQLGGSVTPGVNIIVLCVFTESRDHRSKVSSRTTRASSAHQTRRR